MSRLSFLRQSLPGIAVAYNDDGLTNYCAGHLTSARFNFERALRLNPDYLEAHFNLGQLSEDLQDFGEAQTRYQIALEGGLTVAYSNLARLHILEENYAAAIPLLLTALQKANEGELKAVLVRCQPDPENRDQARVVDVPEDVLKYDLLKNLGWARLGQGRLAEAETHLQAATTLVEDRAPAYCLQAQVLEGLADSEAALTEWENCLRYASSTNPDEDAWIGLARQRFQTDLEIEGDGSNETDQPDSE